MAKTKTIWLSRDLWGEYADVVFFREVEPFWDQAEGDYRCDDADCDEKDDAEECGCHLAKIDINCPDFQDIMQALGIDNGDVEQGQLIKLTASISITQEQSNVDNAKDVLQRMKSRKGKQPSKKEIMEALIQLVGNDE